MSVRVLSGILETRNYASGNATIHFIDHRVTGTLTQASKAQELGIRRRFRDVPCKIVSMREIKMQETERSISRERTETDYLRINDTVVNRDYLEIEWKGTGGSRIEEISYMIIGEVAD